MKYFKEASGHFLAEELTCEEFDKILQDGEILPVAEDFEGWDPDYLEEQIKLLARTLVKVYNEAIWDAAEVAVGKFNEDIILNLQKEF